MEVPPKLAGRFISLISFISFISWKIPFGGFHGHGGTPHSWMVYNGKYHEKMDDGWGYPHLWSPDAPSLADFDFRKTIPATSPSAKQHIFSSVAAAEAITPALRRKGINHLVD